MSKRHSKPSPLRPDGGVDIKARYRQRCAACSKPIKPGEEIVWYPSGHDTRPRESWHRSCVTMPIVPPRPQPAIDDTPDDDAVWLCRLGEKRDA